MKVERRKLDLPQSIKNLSKWLDERGYEDMAARWYANDDAAKAKDERIAELEAENKELSEGQRIAAEILCEDRVICGNGKPHYTSRLRNKCDYCEVELLEQQLREAQETIAQLKLERSS